MKRIPEIIVFLVLPLIATGVYQYQQSLLMSYGQSFHVDRFDVIHDLGVDGRYRVWASPPGPVRDVLRAGAPGVAVAGLAVLLMGAVIGSLVSAVRRPGQAPRSYRHGRTMALRVAVLVALIAIGTGTAGLSVHWRGFYRAHLSPVQLFDDLAPGIAILRVGAGLSAVAMVVALLLGFAEVHSRGNRG